MGRLDAWVGRHEKAVQWTIGIVLVCVFVLPFFLGILFSLPGSPQRPDTSPDCDAVASWCAPAAPH
jgi:hypothetical protein